MKSYKLLLICTFVLFGSLQAQDSDTCPADKTHFVTCEIKNKKNIKAVRTTLKNWGLLSVARAIIAQVSDQIDEKHSEEASSSYGIISSIDEVLKKQKGKFQLHVALDDTNTIQAIAITQLAKGANKLELLATHPENIEIFGYEKPTRGAGTAIITHLANAILNKPTGSTKLHLFALDNAKSFYEKLGFIVNPKDPECHVMKRKSMRALVAKNKDFIDFLDEEPRIVADK